MGHKEILSREIQSLSPEQARGILHYVGYIKILPAQASERSSVSPENRRQAILDGFQKLRELDPFRDIDDPSEWQREVRKDRPLPGRC